ncbi:protein of unknown function [Cyanobium sp. NIES-981]|nr:protein of unknown function [Cyanobium sp. NIES-981]
MVLCLQNIYRRAVGFKYHVIKGLDADTYSFSLR